MSDDLRVRLFLEQVEEVEQLLQYKQKVESRFGLGFLWPVLPDHCATSFGYLPSA